MGPNFCVRSSQSPTANGTNKASISHTGAVTCSPNGNVIFATNSAIAKPIMMAMPPTRGTAPVCSFCGPEPAWSELKRPCHFLVTTSSTAVNKLTSTAIASVTATRTFRSLLSLRKDITLQRNISHPIDVKYCNLINVAAVLLFAMTMSWKSALTGLSSAFTRVSLLPVQVIRIGLAMLRCKHRQFDHRPASLQRHFLG